jgi:hypothetical protein
VGERGTASSSSVITVVTPRRTLRRKTSMSGKCPGCHADECWSEHPEYSGLWVSNLGRVRSAPREVTQRNRWGGINTVRLPTRDYKPTRRQHRVHVLMLESFIGPRPGSKWHACHRDDVGTHNCLENLRWDTPRTGMARNGQGKMWGETNPLTTIPSETVQADPLVGLFFFRIERRNLPPQERP